jgi:L-alanine-DL-glutamate epimerase-like enolase superfamily enzyme
LGFAPFLNSYCLCLGAFVAILGGGLVGCEIGLWVIEAVMHNAKLHEHYIFDANQGLNLADALRCANFLSRYDVIFEQSTKTYEEFYALRKRSSVPLMMDEIFTGMETMWCIIKDKTCEMINLKIAKVGGLSQAKLIRDICAEHGIPLSIQCCGGSEITQAAFMHLAQSTRPPYMHCIWDCTEVNRIKLVSNPLDVTGGNLRPSGLPGLGVTPDMNALGPPVATFS